MSEEALRRELRTSDLSQPVGDVACAAADVQETKLPRCCSLASSLLDGMYAMFAWRDFIAINSPDNVDANLPFVAKWTDAAELFPEQPAPSPPSCAAVDYAQLATPSWLVPDAHVPTGLPEASTLWDQNGNPVIEQVLLNPTEAEHVRGMYLPPLNRVDGQLYAGCNRLGSVVWGEPNGSAGAGHVKLVWIQLGPDADRDRFVRRAGAEQGLVAAHLTLKTRSSGETWIWATFEHVDNLEPADGRPPLFRDPDCTTCPPNVCPEPGEDGVLRTQVERVQPIDERTQVINRWVRAELEQRGSALQFYQLIGVQRPSCNDPPLPTPERLASAIIEWDHQSSSCIGCHSYAPVWSFRSPRREALCAQRCRGPELACEGGVSCSEGACQNGELPLGLELPLAGHPGDSFWQLASVRQATGPD